MAKIGLMLAGLLLYTAAAAEKTQFKGDYNTGSIRYVWMVCADEMQKRMVPSKVFWKICDCVTDSLRRRISQSEYFGADQKKQYEITFKVTTMCLNLMPQKESI